MLRLGFVGSGFISHFHARAIAQIRNAEIVGVVSRSDAQEFVAACTALGVGKVKVFSNIKEMCQHVDTVAIYAPNFLRLEMLEEIVAARKSGASVSSVICEKPLGRTVAEARKIVALCKEADLRTAYFENQIFMNTIQAQRAQLAPLVREMGPLTLVRSAEEHGGPHNGWFWDPRLQGGGVLSDMGCHSIAVGWYVLTPPGKPLNFLKPVSVSCEVACLKWAQPKWREVLRARYGVDWEKTPAEDFTTGVVTFENPETKQRVKAQFTDSWMYEKQGLRLFMDGTGPGYAFEINTLKSPLEIFISDQAAIEIKDAEFALEKSTASRGLLSVQANEPDLYGYTDENRDMVQAFTAKRDALLDFNYGLEITRLVLAAYCAAERRTTIDLTSQAQLAELEHYVPLIQQGRGAEVLF